MTLPNLIFINAFVQQGAITRTQGAHIVFWCIFNRNRARFFKFRIITGMRGFTAFKQAKTLKIKEIKDMLKKIKDEHTRN